MKIDDSPPLCVNVNSVLFVGNKKKHCHCISKHKILLCFVQCRTNEMSDYWYVGLMTLKFQNHVLSDYWDVRLVKCRTTVHLPNICRIFFNIAKNQVFPRKEMGEWLTCLKHLRLFFDENGLANLCSSSLVLLVD